MKATPPLHPNPQNVPSVTDSAPLPKWGDAVEQGRQIALASLTEHSLPGLSVAVGVGGEIVWAEGFGWANLENRVPVKPGTRFRIGTASTALTSAAVGLLLEKGRLKLDDKIQTYVPEFPQHQWPVTLRQLMGHVAGVPNDGGDEGPLFSEGCRVRQALLRWNSRRRYQASRSMRRAAFKSSNESKQHCPMEFLFPSHGWAKASLRLSAHKNPTPLSNTNSTRQ